MFKSLSRFFKKITKFFQAIGEVFKALGRLIPNFPKLLMCMIKIAVLSVINMILLIPGVDMFAVVLLNLPVYLLNLHIRIVYPVFMFVFVAWVALFDIVLGSLTGPTSLGLRMHSVITLFNTCLNDPRAWFSLRRWHRGNRYSRLFGVMPCMSPCFAGYEPLGVSGGLLCKKLDIKSPEFCTAAAVTRVAEGMSYAPLPLVSVSSDECRDRERDRLSANQKLLVNAVCQQPDEFDNNYLRVPCYERYCSRPSSDESGPTTCTNLVPYQSRASPVHKQLVMVAVLVAAGCNFFFTMVTSIRAKQDEYAQLNESFVQDKARLELPGAGAGDG